MEKIKPLKSSDIPNDCTHFKLHLSYIEKEWTNQCCATESYQSLNGNYFSYIFNLTEDDKQIVGIDLYIDKNATVEAVNHFLDIVLSEENVQNLFPGCIQFNLQSNFFDHVIKVLTEGLGSTYREEKSIFEHDMLIAPDTVPEEMTLPQGYTLRPLTEEYINFLTKQWAIDFGMCKDPNMDEKYLIVKNIANRPAFGIFCDSAPSRPIAWITLHSGGSAGILHVMEDHRRKGLARILLRHIIRVVQDVHGLEYRLHACVKFGNDAALKLLQSEGWELQPYNSKKRFFHENARKRMLASGELDS